MSNLLHLLSVEEKQTLSRIKISVLNVHFRDTKYVMLLLALVCVLYWFPYPTGASK